VTSIQLGELDFDFTDPNELIVTLSSPEMNVGVLVVPGIPIPITASRQFVSSLLLFYLFIFTSSRCSASALSFFPL
jgi:hypothetical protein